MKNHWLEDEDDELVKGFKALIKHNKKYSIGVDVAYDNSNISIEGTETVEIDVVADRRNPLISPITGFVYCTNDIDKETVDVKVTYFDTNNTNEIKYEEIKILRPLGHDNITHAEAVEAVKEVKKDMFVTSVMIDHSTLNKNDRIYSVDDVLPLRPTSTVDVGSLDNLQSKAFLENVKSKWKISCFVKAKKDEEAK